MESENLLSRGVVNETTPLLSNPFSEEEAASLVTHVEDRIQHIFPAEASNDETPQGPTPGPSTRPFDEVVSDSAAVADIANFLMREYFNNGGDAENISEQVRERTEHAAVELVKRGYDTPEKVRKVIDDMFQHDFLVRMAGSSASQVGYGAGVALFAFVVAKAIMEMKPDLSSVALGAISGVVIGAFVLSSQKVIPDMANDLLYDSVPKPIPDEAKAEVNQTLNKVRPSLSKLVMVASGVAGGSALLKNLPRIGAAEMLEPIVTRTHGRIVDYSVDASLALASKPFGDWLTKQILGPDKKGELLARTDFGDLLDQYSGVGSSAILHKWKTTVPKSLSDFATNPATYTTTVAACAILGLHSFLQEAAQKKHANDVGSSKSMMTRGEAVDKAEASVYSMFLLNLALPAVAILTPALINKPANLFKAAADYTNNRFRGLVGSSAVEAQGTDSALESGEDWDIDPAIKILLQARANQFCQPNRDIEDLPRATFGQGRYERNLNGIVLIKGSDDGPQEAVCYFLDTKPEVPVIIKAEKHLIGQTTWNAIKEERPSNLSLPRSRSGSRSR